VARTQFLRVTELKPLSQEVAMADTADTGACAIIRTLHAAGVDTIFANPGTTEMVLVDALDRVRQMRAVLCLHETVCSGAADGFGRMSGRPACTLLHLGVGLANATANLHNAKRAATPIVNLVGDMASWHAHKDPLLASDVTGLATFTSKFVKTCDASPDDLASTVVEALLAIRDHCVGESRVATLIIPHDAQRKVLSKAWLPPRITSSLKFDFMRRPRPLIFQTSLSIHNSLFSGNDAVSAHLHQCASKLFSEGARSALVIGGDGLVDEAALLALLEIESISRCALVVENSFARVERGSGRPSWQRIPYFPADARRFFEKFESVMFCGARPPVAMFGYEDGLSDLVPETIDCVEIDTCDVAGM